MCRQKFHDNTCTYEIIFIIRKNTYRSKRLEITANLCSLLRSFKASVKNVEYLGVHPIISNQREIKKNSQGKYVVLEFNVNPNHLKEILYNLKIDSYIIRYSLVKK